MLLGNREQEKSALTGEFELGKSVWAEQGGSLPFELDLQCRQQGFVHYPLTPPSRHCQPGSPTCSRLIQTERFQTQVMKMRIGPHQNAAVHYNSLAQNHSSAGAAKTARNKRD